MEEERTPTSERIGESTSGSQVGPRAQVVQLVRSIGAQATSEVQSVASVNAELEALYAKGFRLTAVRPVGAVPGGMTVYYMFTKGV